MELILIAILVFLSVLFETSIKQGPKCGTNTKPLTAPPKRPSSPHAQSIYKNPELLNGGVYSNGVES